MSVRLKVLAVDDEEAVLDGLELHLRKKYQVVCRVGGAAGLEALQANHDFAVILSDMRMPGMSGAVFLSKAKEIAPQASRLLLTGQTDLDSAIAAINEGQIFRFLAKPCPPATLMAAVDAAAELHRLILAEKELLENTLRGAIKALTDVLALTSPGSFGRATRIKRLACLIADEFPLPSRWQLEVGAMLSQLGYVSLPAETMAKVAVDAPLSPDEKVMVERVPKVLEQLIGPIPRLERFLEMIALSMKPPKGRPKDGEAERLLLFQQAHILRVACAYDVLEASGLTPELALRGVQGRVGQYEGEVVERLATVVGEGTRVAGGVRDLPPSSLAVGMILLQDVKTKAGVLIVPKGYEVTSSFVERVKNYPVGNLPNSVRALVRAAPGDSEK